MRAGRNLSAFLGALQPQFALVIALVQITDGRYDISTTQRFPDTIVRSDLRAVLRKSELRVWPQVCSNFIGLHLLHVCFVGLQRRIGGFKLSLDLFPCEAGLSIHRFAHEHGNTCTKR